MTGIIVMTTAGAAAPAPERETRSGAGVLAGPIDTTTWNHWTGESGRLLCGIWEASPGTTTIDYAEWEFCHFIEGEAILTDEAGRSWHLKAGDGFIIPPGFKGTWETVKPVRKHYVILMPAGPGEE